MLLDMSCSGHKQKVDKKKRSSINLFEKIPTFYKIKIGPLNFLNVIFNTSEWVLTNLLKNNQSLRYI